jgi:hypothetical protein
MADGNGTATRAPTFIIAFLCLLICCAVVSFVGPRARRGPLEKQAVPVISLERRIQSPGFKSAGFTSTNQFFVLSGDDAIQVFSPSGIERWSAHIGGSSDVVLSADGKCAMTYSRRDPTSSTLTFIDSAGRVVWTADVDGAVWCADSCRSGDGARFIVGTGKGRVYVIDVGARTKRYRRWRMPGAVVSLAACEEGDGVVAASWQRSAVRLADLNGHKRWQAPVEPHGMHKVTSLGKSGRVLVEYVPLDSRADGSYEMLDRSGRRMCGGVVSVDEDTHVVTSPSGRYLAAGVCKQITHKGKSMREHHTVLMDGTGRVLWEKGSPFFQAVPLAVTDAGYVVISDGQRSVFTISPSGEMRPALKVVSPVRGCTASRDGSRLLLDCCDSTLVLLHVTG